MQGECAFLSLVVIARQGPAWWIFFHILHHYFTFFVDLVHGNNILVVAPAVLRVLKGLAMKIVLKKNVVEQVQGDCTFEFWSLKCGVFGFCL